MLAGLLMLGGCGTGGFSLQQADVDRTIVTSNIPASTTSDDSNLADDQATIRNAVSSADVEALAGKNIAWANPDTGSRGAIKQLTESKTGELLCRQFTATRESFDGVALFKGKACSIGDGAWRMQAFAAQ